MSAIDRFRKRQNGAMTFDVPWPTKEEPKIIFRVNRFAQAEMTAATWAAEKNLRDRGIERTNPVWEETWNWALGYAIAEFVKKHVKSWTFKIDEGEEPIIFSQATLEGIVADMNEVEKAQFGWAYVLALVDEDTKKKETETTSVATS
jgi:hypothetical protein